MITIYEIWNELLEFGYTSNDDISYFDFVQCCDNVGVEPSEHIIETLEEMYGVYIG